MRQDWFDKKLADSFEDFDSNMDFEMAWEGMEAKRKKKKKRGFAFWLSSMGVLVLLSIGTAFYFFENENVTVVEQISESELTRKKELKNEEGLFDMVEKINSQEKRSAKNENNKVADSKTKKIENKIPETTFNLVENKIAPKTIVEKAKTSKLHPSFNENSQNEIVALEIKNEKSIDPITSNNKEIETPSLALDFAKRQQTPPSLFPFDLNPDFVAKSNLDKFLLKNKNRRNKMFFTIGASIAYGLNGHSFNAINVDQEIWVNARNENEKPLDAVYADLFVKKYFNKNVYLQTGIGCLHSTTRFEHIENDEYTELMDGQLVEIVQYLDGTQEEIYGEGEVLFKDEITTTAYNRNQSVLLPILFGIDFPLNKKVGIDFSAGAAISLFSKISGQIISDENTIESYIDLNNLAYKKQGVLYGQANAGVYFNLNKNWQLAGGLQTLVGLNNQMKKESGVEEKMRFLGGRISLVNNF